MTPPSPRTWHLLFLLSLPLALLALVAPETQVHWYDPAKLGLFDPLEPFNEWEEPIGFGEDVYVERLVAGQVFWPTPFVLVEGVGLPDINDSSTWLKVGALARSATAFYGLELVDDVTKWVEIGGKQDLWYDLHDLAGGSIRPSTDQSPLLFRGQGGITVTVLESQPNEVIISASEIASGMDSILHFSEDLLENSNHPEFQVELPEGKEVQELMWLEVGIPIPVRCATVTVDGFISIYQPYCWFTTDMKAKGTLRLRDTG